MCNISSHDVVVSLNAIYDYYHHVLETLLGRDLLVARIIAELHRACRNLAPLVIAVKQRGDLLEWE
jgi:phosphopentomutase